MKKALAVQSASILIEQPPLSLGVELPNLCLIKLRSADINAESNATPGQLRPVTCRAGSEARKKPKSIAIIVNF